MGVIFFPILFFISFAVTFASLDNSLTNNPLQSTKRWQEWQEKQRMRFYLTRHWADKWTNLELTSKWIAFHKIQIYELTTQRLARDRTQVPKLTSNQLVFPMDWLAYHRMYVIELTGKWIARYEIQVIESTTDRLTCHKIQVYDLTSNQLMYPGEQVMCYRIQVLESTSNQLMCQKPLPCTLTFKVSSIKHWTPIQIPPPFHYPNTPYQILTRHIPTVQRETINLPTGSQHSIYTSSPTKEI